MTEPRQKIRSLLGKFGCLTTGQIYHLLGIPRAWDPANSAQRNVRQILKAGSDAKPAAWYRGDLFKGRKHGRAQTEAVYWMDSAERRPRFLAHDVAVSEAHIALGPDIPWREYDLCHDGVNPDAIFYSQKFFFFLELERQRNSFKKRSSCLRKAQRYLEFKKSGDLTRYTFLVDGQMVTMKDFYVLFVFAEDPEFRDSAEELRDNALHAFMKEGLTYQRFKLATLADVCANPQGEVWHSPNGKISTLV